MWGFIVKGGPVMIPIILGSIIGLAIILEKLWMFNRLRINTQAFADEVFQNIRSNKVQKALWLCDHHIEHPLAAVLKVGIERRASGPERLEKIMEQAGNTQILRLEKRLGGLASIASISPLMGFLGTITGLIKAFMSWEGAGANVTVSLLALGIYEAMLTTAAGLIVAIPYFLCYNYFISRIKYLATEMNEYSMQFIDMLADAKGDQAK
ncbi:MAG TPA: MotA/TolQ/ExbB proton channel family protein [Candidatus Omnitrophota bacterium]|nr:MotA/TolQ/ExbB proton channel family protein [Candidatus Omnitrophota bacterium]HNQ50613.1 MotA/TolQ/ExbB proton channel family protein [Candidatus Omnitrophota bacterium]HQO38573.1 MotA/TolQ/ExbB proton channel family protein [Candidatus Omnitrophota bacterium]HQQ06168.1 MotA/TolQ/ExbB proton channel family protein [Candidatus Omnitrophota bacterium]